MVATATPTITLRDTLDRPAWFAVDSGGCRWYRCELPARVAGGVVRDGIERHRDPLTGLVDAYHGAGSPSVFSRPAARDILAIIRDIKSAGGRVVVDLDDDVWAIGANHPQRRAWRKDHTVSLAAALRLADRATVSTQPLAETVRRYNRDVRVVANAIDPTDFPEVVRPDDGIVRLGWAGSLTHVTDLRPVLPALLELGRRPDVELHFYGYDPFHDYRQGRPTPGVRTHRGVPYVYHAWAALPDHYAAIGTLDIAIAPLLDNPFNWAKSAVKWLEHAMHGTAMVLADVYPYREAAEHGVTALLAATPADWRKYLTLLIERRDLRERIGARARAVVLARDTIGRRAAEWRGALSCA